MAKKMQLDKLLKGALNEMFNREIQRVAANIWDANTSPGSKRQIVIKLDIKPDEERQIGEISATVQSKLCPAKSVNGKFVFGYNAVTREGEASELNADMLGQVSMDDLYDADDDEAQEQQNVIDLRKKESVK